MNLVVREVEVSEIFQGEKLGRHLTQPVVLQVKLLQLRKALKNKNINKLKKKKREKGGG